jgi:hypothetical protein
MSTHYDEKGKFFTDIISKRNIPVIIQTITNRMEGIVHVRRGERLKDELDSSEKFMAVTDVVIFDSQGAELYRVEFLAINRNKIVWIFPTDGEEGYIGE